MKTCLNFSVLFLWAANVSAAGAPAFTRPAEGGVVVVEVGEGSALHAAGIRPGDRLLSWQRKLQASETGQGMGGEIRTVFDWEWVKVEQRPRGAVELRGLRDGEPEVFTVHSGSWLGRVRPPLSRVALASFREGLGLIASGQTEQGIRRVQAVAETSGPACWLFLRTGDALVETGSHDEALEAYQAAFGEARGPRAQAFVSDALGELWKRLGEFAAAREAYTAALEIRRLGTAGESLSVARSRSHLGHLAWNRGDLKLAAEQHRHALATRQSLAPDSLAVADSLKALGTVAGLFGDLGAATDHISRALEIQEDLAPGSLEMAGSLNHLGILAGLSGKRALAESYFSQALVIRESLDPGSLDVAATLINLGRTAWERGDLDGAQSRYRGALTVQEKLAPGSQNLAILLKNLGLLAWDRGDGAAAQDYWQRALVIREDLEPGSIFVADSLYPLGRMAIARGELETAERHFRRSLEIQQRITPGSLNQADSLFYLGDIAALRGDFTTAASYQRRALAIREALAPGSKEEAESLHALGRISLKSDRHEAAKLFERAIDSLESQIGSLGGSQDVKSVFRARYRRLYQDAIDLLLELGREAEAFHMLERSRARSFLAMLAEKDLLGDLRYPEPLDLAGARGALDPGTVLLSYHVGPRSSAIFAVTRDSFTVARLELSEQELRKQVLLLRRLIRAAGSATEIQAIRRSQLASVGRQLYEKLIRPVAERIERGERLLISPDGPLHVLAFRSLVADSDGRYLIEWKPLHLALSATVFNELKKARRASGKDAAAALTAFGDPNYPQERVDLRPLPHSRKEIERITALYPPAGVEAYLGEAATEERVKSVGRASRILHFATHATIDDKFPLHSALALSIPENPQESREDGLLQTLEIFEELRLDADLVILSACETALGKERAGEGLIGLTRAFQYAGARSVVASLWSVQDDVTAELMERFHRNLRNRSTTDEALRAAQVELIRQAAPPWNWAAFELYGDWR